MHYAALLRVATQVTCLGLAGVAWSTPPIFGLTTREVTFENKPLAEHPIIARIEHRELGRQAVLLAARETLGCATRDQTLGERLDPATQLVLDATIESRHGQGLRIILRRGDETVYDTEIEHRLGPIFDIQALARKLEPLTRTGLADALAEAGVEGDGHKQVDSAPVPEGVPELLVTMDHLSQHEALRKTHRAVRESGESPERLAGLARGYANLAMLNMTTLDARSMAYRARAMLYLERLRRRVPDTSEATWNATYVYALIGYPTMALNALEEDEGVRDAEGVPEWLEVVIDACYHNYEELENVAYNPGDAYAQLAAILLMRSAKTSGSIALVMEAGKECLQVAPGCLWIGDAMHDSAGVALRHRTSVLGPAAHLYAIAKTLPETTELPPSTRKAVEGIDPESPRSLQVAEIAQTLLEAARDDTQEPSWGALGAEMRAWNTLHIYRRATFLRDSLGTDAASFIHAVEPALADDPWAPVIRSLGIRKTQQVDGYNRVLADFELLDTNYLSSGYWPWQVPRD